ncbi:aminoacyl-tRNA hydrolase [soil metagenome]
MIVLVGLGNPSEKYSHNRHNVGFMFADYLLKSLTTRHTSPVSEFKFDKYANAELARLDLAADGPQQSVILVKPQTYMNRSGETVRQLMASNKIPIENIFVAHDDLDIELGKFKIQLGVGPKKHNGLSSIEDLLHNHNFWRIRIGVDNRNGDRTLSGEEYVLQNFSGEENIILETTLLLIKDRFLTTF